MYEDLKRKEIIIAQLTNRLNDAGEQISDLKNKVLLCKICASVFIFILIAITIHNTL